MFAKCNLKQLTLFGLSVFRLKRHYSQYPDNMQALKKKYEAAMKEKMMANLERDRALGQVTGLQSTIKNLELSQGKVN